MLSDVLERSRGRTRWDRVVSDDDAAATSTDHSGEDPDRDRWGNGLVVRDRATTGRARTRLNSAEHREPDAPKRRTDDVGVRRPKQLAGRTRPKKSANPYLDLALWVSLIGFIVVASSLIMWLIRSNGDEETVTAQVAGEQIEDPSASNDQFDLDAVLGEPGGASEEATGDETSAFLDGLDTTEPEAPEISTTSSTVAPNSVVFGAGALELFVYDDGPAPSEGLSSWVFAIRIRNDGDIDLQTTDLLINVVGPDGASLPSSHRFEHTELPSGSSALASVDVELLGALDPGTLIDVQVIGGGEVVVANALTTR